MSNLFDSDTNTHKHKHSNNNLSISFIYELIKQTMGSNYDIILGGDEDNKFYIRNKITGKNNYEFKYENSIDYGTLPWVIRKSFVYREITGINASSEYSIFNPTKEEIIALIRHYFP